MAKAKDMNYWKCDKCGKKLPRKGIIWAGRFNQSREFRAERNEISGYLCDSCARAQEEGCD